MCLVKICIRQNPYKKVRNGHNILESTEKLIIPHNHRKIFTDKFNEDKTKYLKWLSNSNITNLKEVIKGYRFCRRLRKDDIIEYYAKSDNVLLCKIKSGVTNQVRFQNSKESI